MRDRLPLIAVVLLCLSPAQAGLLEDTTGYATLGLSHLQAYSSATDSATLRVGARFNAYLGAEGTIDLGIDQDVFDTSYCPQGQVCPQYIRAIKIRLKTAEAIYGVGFLPLFDHADLFVRLGYGAAQYSEFDQDSVNLGAGVQYFFYGGNGIRADYTRHFFVNDVQPNDPRWGHGQDVFSLSYVRRF